MKYFVTSDVHSCFNELMIALDNAGFKKDNPEHVLCVCGDLFDRGEGSVPLFEFVKDLHSKKRLIYIRGNHEDLLMDCMDNIQKGIYPGQHHYSNGTIQTICQFCNKNSWAINDPSCRSTICKTMQPVLNFINENCVDYAEIGDYILVHGWIPSFSDIDDFRSADKSAWEQARWLNGMDMWLNPANRIEGKTIICGHWHCSWGWSHIRLERKEFPQKNREDWQKSFEPFVDDGIIAIDAATASTGIVNVITLNIE